MTVEEVEKAIDELKAQGADDESILYSFYKLFQDDKINVEELGALCDVLGYELTDEFKNMSPEDQKTKGFTETEDEVDEEVAEEAKEFPAEDKDAEKDADEKPAEDDEDDEAERKEAHRLFGIK